VGWWGEVRGGGGGAGVEEVLVCAVEHVDP